MCKVKGVLFVVLVFLLENIEFWGDISFFSKIEKLFKIERLFYLSLSCVEVW